MSSENISRRHLKFANKLFCRDCGGQLSVDDFKAVPMVCRDALYNNVHCADCTRLCWICDGPTPATLNKVLNRGISTEEESPLESGKSHTPPPVSSDSSLPSEMVVISDGDEEAINGRGEVDSRGTSTPFVVYADFEAKLEASKTNVAVCKYHKFSPLGMEESAQLESLKVFYKTVENELTIVIRKLMSINDKYPDDISLPGAINELQNLRNMCVRYG